jgi:hypothetical protein
MPAAPCPGCRRHLVPHAGGSGDAGRKLTQCHDKDIRVQEKERGGGVPAPLLSRHRRAEDEEEVAGRAARHQDEEEDTGRRQVALCAAE